MRVPFLISLLVAFLVGGVAWYRLTESICPSPLPYRIDTIADEFSLSKEQAKIYLQQAEAVWEKELGRELFYYDDNADLVVDFVFDERQAMADSEYSRRAELDSKKAEHEDIFAAIEKLQTEYEALSSDYAQNVDDYEKRLNAYNQKVNSYNDRGGAPSDVYAELEREKNQLNQEVASLSEMSTTLNTLAREISESGEKGNRLVEEYNYEVASYNKQFGFAREFTQGDYQGDRINVYKFSDERELLAVLAHEFGHALGIGHVEGETSVMYYLLEDTSNAPSLSQEDSAALITLCGSGDEPSHKIRRAIRTFLATF